MKIYENFNKIQNCLIIPIIAGSVFISLGEILLIIGQNTGGGVKTALTDFSQLLFALLPYAFCYYFSVCANKGKRWLMGSWSVLCLALFLTAYKTVCGGKSSVLFGLIVGFTVWFCRKYFDNKFVFAGISAFMSLLFGLALGYAYDLFTDINMSLSSFISGKGIFSSALFAVFKTVYDLFDSSNFAEMFFYKSYGGTMFVNDQIITGVKDLFAENQALREVSTYLSGHYYLLFSVFGVCIGMMSNLKGIQKIALIFAGVGMIISGNPVVAFIFLFLESPAIFISVIIISVLAYVSACVINVGAGYLFDGGIVEYFIYPSNKVYLIAGSIVFLAIGFFVYKYCYERYGISDCYNIYVPSRLQSVVDALGGVKNIIRFKDDYVEVRNSQLINNLSFECEINENTIKSDSETFKELKEYFDEDKGRTF